MILYTIGYTGRTPNNLLNTLIEVGRPHLVDVRYSPYSRNSHYNLKAIRSAARSYKVKYRHVQALGNKNYRGGPVVLEDQNAGLAILSDMLEKSPVCIMCMCRSLTDCHRKFISDAMSGRLPELSVVHL